MNIKEQVCNLNYGRRLKQLGIYQDSFFYWIKNKNIKKWEIRACDSFHKHDYHEFISAFTTDELIYKLSLLTDSLSLVTIKPANSNVYCVQYDKSDLIFVDKKIVDSLAYTLIYFIENKM